MAVKIDLNEIVSSTSKFCFDFHFFKLRGLADIPAKEFFLAMQEMDTIIISDPVQAVIDCMSPLEKAEYEDSIKTLELTSDDNAPVTYYMRKFILKNNIPTLPTIEARLMYAFVALEAKYLNICVNKMLVSAVANRSLDFDFTSNKVGSVSAETFVSEIRSAQSINEIAQTLFSYEKKDYQLIYQKLIRSIYDFFQLAK